MKLKRVSTGELGRVLEAFGVKVSKKKLEQMIAEVDTPDGKSKK